MNWTNKYRRIAGPTALTRNVFLRVVSLCILLETLMAVAGALASFTWPKWVPLPAAVVSLAGFVVVLRATKASVMVLAMAMASLSLGIFFGPVTATYGGVQIVHAIVFTGFTMVVMSLLGVVFPRLFDGWGPYLTAGLVVLATVLGAFALLGKTWVLGLAVINWAGIILFMALVAFDWSSAIGSPHTLENAIWAAALLFLDGANLFVRALGATDEQHQHEPEDGSSDRR